MEEDYVMLNTHEIYNNMLIWYSDMYNYFRTNGKFNLLVKGNSKSFTTILDGIFKSDISIFDGDKWEKLHSLIMGHANYIDTHNEYDHMLETSDFILEELHSRIPYFLLLMLADDKPEISLKKMTSDNSLYVKAPKQFITKYDWNKSLSEDKTTTLRRSGRRPESFVNVSGNIYRNISVRPSQKPSNVSSTRTRPGRPRTTTY